MIASEKAKKMVSHCALVHIQKVSSSLISYALFYALNFIQICLFSQFAFSTRIHI